MFVLYPSKAPRQGGNPCPEIGDRIGRAILISTDRPFPFESLPVMARPLQPTMLFRLAGSLDKLFKELSFSWNGKEQARRPGVYIYLAIHARLSLRLYKYHAEAGKGALSIYACSNKKRSWSGVLINLSMYMWHLWLEEDQC